MKARTRITIVLLLLLLPIIILLNSNKSISDHKLAIIVPFRDRFDELMSFVPLLTDFLHNQDIKTFKFYIINQSHRYRFNRGALANVGYLIAKEESDYIAIHDVDLIPLNMNLSYHYPQSGPYHVASPEYHPQYNYKKYLGGIIIINNEHFELVNGMSNRYFGWGLEDDEFYTRITAAKLKIFRPERLTTNKSNTFLHLHNRKRDSFKTKEQRDILRTRDKITGLRDIKYSIINSNDLTIDGKYHCTIYNTELSCDKIKTPWCSTEYARENLIKL